MGTATERRVSVYEINVHKSVALLYINSEQADNQIKNSVPLIIAAKQNKTPENNLNQGGERSLQGEHR